MIAPVTAIEPYENGSIAPSRTLTTGWSGPSALASPPPSASPASSPPAGARPIRPARLV
eukprot:SAG22_NODE_8984_length_616_cov_1.425532_1_plen_58_part_10